MRKLLLGIAVSSSLAACRLGPTSSCVARGTRIRTPDGERFVEDLAVGDLVMVVNPSTGEAVASPLLAVISAHREVGAITFGHDALEVTSDHPVFDPDTGSFHDAGDWLLGQRRRLLRSEGSRVEAVAVTATQAFVRLTTVFDLTVEHEWHTFVANGVVVHNKSIAFLCQLPDGGLVAPEASPCDCGNGMEGRWSCEAPGEPAVCRFCGRDLADGGVP
jgi:hypothetical protein